jgi:hypothetical protein
MFTLKLREEHGLMVLENRIMRKIRVSVPKKEEVRGRWKELYTEKLHGFHSPLNISSGQIKDYEMDGACDTYGGQEKCI